VQDTTVVYAGTAPPHLTLPSEQGSVTYTRAHYLLFLHFPVWLPSFSSAFGRYILPVALCAAGSGRGPCVACLRLARLEGRKSWVRENPGSIDLAQRVRLRNSILRLTVQKV